MDAVGAALPSAPKPLSFWLRVAVKLSETEPWWYDTLAEYARRCRYTARGTLVGPSAFLAVRFALSGGNTGLPCST